MGDECCDVRLLSTGAASTRNGAGVGGSEFQPQETHGRELGDR